MLRQALETTCPDCNGSGWVTGSEFKENDLRPSTPKEQGSRRCGCVDGKVPTTLGEQVLEFVKDHLESWVSEQSKNHTHGRGE